MKNSPHRLNGRKRVSDLWGGQTFYRDRGASRVIPAEVAQCRWMKSRTVARNSARASHIVMCAAPLNSWYSLPGSIVA